MFRLGAPSYLIPDDILPNVDYLIQLGLDVSDVQLLLFESDEHGTNLPTPDVVRELRKRARTRGLTYTVHLPLDLSFGPNISEHEKTMQVLRRAIERTLDLEPLGYTLHLDGRRLSPPWGKCDGDPLNLNEWQSQVENLLQQLTRWIGSAERLCVENLEGWDPAAFDIPLRRTGASRTVDIGHLWVTGTDPLPMLQAWHRTTRLVHLHGVGDRDHQSLLRMDRSAVERVVRHLVHHFDGVVTLEIFDLPSFRESLDLVRSLCGGRS